MKNKRVLLKKIIVGGLGLPINTKGQYLLTRRNAPDLKAWHNKWQVAGGALEFGETPEETTLRELEEELRVKARIIYPLPIVKTSIWYGHETARRFDSQIVLVVYLVDIGNQAVDISYENETNSFGWFTHKQVMRLDTLPLTRDIVAAAETMCSQYGLRRLLE